jgi:hypothetical protein
LRSCHDFFLILILTSTVRANQNQSHQEGKSFGKSLLNGVKSASKTTNPELIPGFETTKPKESTFTAEMLKNEAVSAAQRDNVAQHITEQASNRQTFKIDPATDPLFVDANQALTDPEKTLSETITEVPGSDADPGTLQTCEESGEEYPQSCSRKLEIALEITPEKGHYKHSQCKGHWKNKITGTKKYCKGLCKKRRYIIDQARKVAVTREEWVDHCRGLENLVDQGMCRYASHSTSPKNETRQIQGESITRDHFEEYNHYACFKTSPKTCAGLREKGCFQVSSVCKESVEHKCVTWEQTYRCPSGKRSLTSYQSGNASNPFCLTGNCADTSYEANGEMLQVTSQLVVLREAQRDIKNKIEIFKGEDQRCSRNCLDFKDCCGNGKGWGVSIHLASCTPEEKKLADLRQKNQCVRVGTYCDEEFMGTCIRKKTSFCCYGNKIARLIQENARSQLGLGWGTPKAPKCEGLPPEHLSKIDFSKIDFSELFADIKAQMVAKGQDETVASVSAERLKNNMAALMNPSLDQKANQTMREKGL